MKAQKDKAFSLSDYLKDLESIVNIDSFSEDAAGVAAALAAAKGVTPRALPYSDLARELERQNVALA